MIYKHFYMIKYKTLGNFLLIIIIFCSCDNSNVEKISPTNNIIEKKTLVNMLADAYIIESILYHKSQEDNNLKENTNILYNNLFNKYNTDYQSFMQSIKYYIENDEKVSEIYLNVITTLIVKKELNSSN